MSRYEAEFELPDGLDPYGGTARVQTLDGVRHGASRDKAVFPSLTVEGIDLNGAYDVRLWASSREDVAALREHLNAALDDLDKAVGEYIAADPKRTTAPPA